MVKQSVKTRVLFGGVMILILVGLAALDIRYYQHYIAAEVTTPVSLSLFNELLAKGLILAVLGIVLAVVGTLEIAHLAEQTGARVFPGIMVVGSAFLVLQAFYKPLATHLDAPAVIGILLIALIVAQMLRRETRGAGANIAWSIFGILYIGLFISYIIALRTDFGPGLPILLISAIKLSDVGAYGTGMVFGKHKLIPWLSPGKTVEGLLGAVIFSVVITILLARLPIINHVPVLAGAKFTHLVLLGVGFAVVGHVGDLAESLLKRDAGAKDSGHLLPEFGGVLDLVDSLLPAGFIGYLLIKWIS
jgi:phosphatidate cytidylyltransferase